MLVTIIVLFMICWGPVTTNNLLVAFDVLDTLHMGALKPIRQAFYVLSYINSCVNPIVYGFMSKNFRKAFIMALGYLCLGRRRQRRMQFWDQTMVRFSVETRYSVSARGSRLTASQILLQREGLRPVVTYDSEDSFSLK